MTLKVSRVQVVFATALKGAGETLLNQTTDNWLGLAYCKA